MRFETMRYVVLGALMAVFGSVLLAVVPAGVAEESTPRPTIVAKNGAVL